MKEISDREKKYLDIVNDILENEEFIKTKDIAHHGLNRYDHSGRVSYYSYKVAKMLGLDYEQVARGALLHDFFLVDNDVITIREKMGTLVNHPKYAAKFASKYFDLTEKEKDMILTHMFPVTPRPPKYIESRIVGATDKCVSICEVFHSRKAKVLSYMNVIAIVMLNFIWK